MKLISSGLENFKTIVLHPRIVKSQMISIMLTGGNHEVRFSRPQFSVAFLPGPVFLFSFCNFSKLLFTLLVVAKACAVMNLIMNLF